MKTLSSVVICSLVFAIITLTCFSIFSCSKAELSPHSFIVAGDSSNIIPDNPPPSDPDLIDLSSKLTMSPTVIVPSGCLATYFANLEINNPLTSQLTASFTLGFYTGTQTLVASVEEINGQPASSHSTLQTFNLESGKSMLIKLKFTLNGQDFDFNRTYIITGKIYPKRLVNNSFSFRDPNPANDLLTQETFIGSSNTICSKCLETATLLQNIQYSFFIPANTGIACQTSLALLSSTSTQAELKPVISKAESAKAYFQFISAGSIPNTSVKAVFIKNSEGKYLTYNNGVPTFMSQITNDVHCYQKWVILNPTTMAGCNNHMYKFIQYLNNNTCTELVQTKSNGKYYLSYRSGISHDNIADKFIMEPKPQIVVVPTTPK